MTRESRTITWMDYTEETFEVVHESTDTWKHGTSRAVVLKDEEGRLWQATYCRDASGDYNTWRDDEPEQTCYRVFPHVVTTTVYKPEPQEQGQ